MDFSDQYRFINNVRKALGRSPGYKSSLQEIFSIKTMDESRELYEKIKTRTSAQRQKLLSRLIDESKTVNLNVICLKNATSVATSIAGLVREKEPEWGSRKSLTAWEHPLIEKLKLTEVLADRNVPVFCSKLRNNKEAVRDRNAEKMRIRKHVIDSYIGVTSADFCIADTATLVMKTRPGQGRLVSLVPSIHIAVIEFKQILGNMKELFILLQHDPKEKSEGLTNCMTFISGPSKTADIEATLVHGAHGPREVYLYVITGR